MKKPKPKTDPVVARVRIRLRQAIARACIARGEAQWTNGYRAATFDRTPKDEAARLYQKEQLQWGECETTERQVEKLMAEYARVVRR